MKQGFPSKVLITGAARSGRAQLCRGPRGRFHSVGNEVEIVSPLRVFTRWRELGDPRVLKILSTGAVFAAPLARRAICMAHGVPQANSQGWRTLVAIVASFKLANLCSGVRLVCVSHYTAASLLALYNIRTDAVVHNAVKPLYLEPIPEPPAERRYVTYVGRLTVAKNLHRIVPAVRDLLDENPGLRMCIIGVGEQQAELEA